MALTKLFLIEKENISKLLIEKLLMPMVMVDKKEIMNKDKIRPYIKKEINFDANALLLEEELNCNQRFYAASYCNVKGLKE